MAQEELIKLDEDALSLTRQGERRAREVIRRHRLSERLFYEMFAIHEDLLDENACKIEHSLSAEVTEKLCIFLKHPQTCPHGSPIPRGVCCPKA
ncbi:MAG TPA: iron dependent repressor, metal binding and dimerization domain protein [Terriglobia bacterium]|nr:iron dependent repressor, metal binding and dimerization domain protein [Terriglobia bacterium]